VNELPNLDSFAQHYFTALDQPRTGRNINRRSSHEEIDIRNASNSTGSTCTPTPPLEDVPLGVTSDV
jgi:hypothetical protein